MKSMLAKGVVVAFCLTGSAVMAADSPVAPLDGIQCIRTFRSAVLDQPRPEVLSFVEQSYEHALEVSERRSVIFNQSQLFTWAHEAKVSCAKAIGFFASGELNEDQVSQCDCYYTRMRLLLR